MRQPRALPLPSRSAPLGPFLTRRRPAAGSCIEARNLESKDGGDDGGTSDPYVRVQCLDKEQRTDHLSRELNPIWDQWLVVDSVRILAEYPLEFAQLLVSVIDHDTISGDDEIGSFEIDLASVWKRPGHCVRPPAALRPCLCHRAPAASL